MRREYAWVPEALWTQGRRKVLQGFLGAAGDLYEPAVPREP